MKSHYHHDAVGIAIAGLEIMIFFHAMRFVGAKLGNSSNKLASTIGTAVGGAFTFGGTS